MNKIKTLNCVPQFYMNKVNYDKIIKSMLKQIMKNKDLNKSIKIQGLIYVPEKS